MRIVSVSVIIKKEGILNVLLFCEYADGYL